MDEHVEGKTLVEAILLSSPLPLTEAQICERLPDGIDLGECLARLSAEYAGRSLRIVRMAGGWTVRTAPEHSGLCREMLPKDVRLSKAAMETLAAIAAFQPLTRPEIERIRGVALAKGTLDILIWAGLVRPTGRRAAPGNPLEFGVTEAFYARYGLTGREELPHLERIRQEGLDGPEPEGDLPPEVSKEEFVGF